jgi:hypothetical protein
MKNVRFIGLDVHAETIAVGVAEPGGEVRSLGTIPNRPEPVARHQEPVRAFRVAGVAGRAARRPAAATTHQMPPPMSMKSATVSAGAVTGLLK